MNSNVTPTRMSSLPITEERYQTIGPLLSFRDMLSKEPGVGERGPMKVQVQAEGSLWMDCPVGYSSEYYAFAIARSSVPENWDAALTWMGALARPLGFGPARKDPPGRNGGQSALLIRRDEARIKIGCKTSSFIRIEIGCMEDEVYEGWPAGMEAIPEWL